MSATGAFLLLIFADWQMEAMLGRDGRVEVLQAVLQTMSLLLYQQVLLTYYKAEYITPGEVFLPTPHAYTFPSLAV